MAKDIPDDPPPPAPANQPFRKHTNKGSHAWGEGRHVVHRKAAAKKKAAPKKKK